MPQTGERVQRSEPTKKCVLSSIGSHASMLCETASEQVRGHELRSMRERGVKKDITMRVDIRRAALVAVAGVALVATGSGSALAAHGGHGGAHSHGGHAFAGHGGGFHSRRGGEGSGPGFVGGLAFGAVVGAPYGYYGAPYGYDSYAYDSGPDCYLTRQVVINRWGHRVIRRVRVCE